MKPEDHLWVMQINFYNYHQVSLNLTKHLTKRECKAYRGFLPDVTPARNIETVAAMLVFQTNRVGVKGSSQTRRLIRQPEVNS